jgi:hypothetical protein
VVAFVTLVVIGFAGVAAVIVYGRRRPVGAPVSWGQAMLAATFAMFMFFWWYAVIPHQWLTWASAGPPDGLGWTVDNILLEPNDWQPLTISYQTVRDIAVVLIYGVGIAIHVGLWAWWNDRAKPRPVAVPASRYGRPLVRKG